jgi:hypothetical protein
MLLIAPHCSRMPHPQALSHRMAHLLICLNTACLHLVVCFVQVRLQCLMIFQHGFNVSSVILLEVFDLPLMFSLAMYAVLAQLVYLQTGCASMPIIQFHVRGEVKFCNHSTKRGP